jgi:hypothetical protein
MVSKKLQLKKYTDSFFLERYIVFFLPFAIVFSKFFLELILITLFLLFLLHAPLKKNIYIFHKKIFLFFILFYFYLLIRYFFRNADYDALSIIFYFRYYFYILSLYYFFNLRKNLLGVFIKSIITVKLLGVLRQIQNHVF